MKYFNSQKQNIFPDQTFQKLEKLLIKLTFVTIIHDVFIYIVASIHEYCLVQNFDGLISTLKSCQLSGRDLDIFFFQHLPKIFGEIRLVEITSVLLSSKILAENRANISEGDKDQIEFLVFQIFEKVGRDLRQNELAGLERCG